MSGRFYLSLLLCLPIFISCSKLNRTIEDLAQKPPEHASPKDFELQATTPMIRAAAQGQIDEVKRLINSGFSVNDGNDNGITPLMAAARKNQVAIVDTLLAAGAYPEAQDVQGSMAIHFAALGSSPGSIASLTKKKAKFLEHKDAFDLTPLMLAVRFANLETIKALIKAGASMYTADPNGWTATHFAIPRSDAVIFDYLLDQNPTLDQLDRDGDSLAILALSYNLPAFTKKLIESGAPIGQTDADGNTLLHHAVNGRNKDLVKWLLANKAPANSTNKLGQTPLTVATKIKETEIAQELLAAGAKLETEEAKAR